MMKVGYFDGKLKNKLNREKTNCFKILFGFISGMFETFSKHYIRMRQLRYCFIPSLSITILVEQFDLVLPQLKHNLFC